MTILKQASLLMLPSGYKEDKLYSINPIDGSGDLSFARSSTGTRVNSDGFIENVPLNLLNYSELFSNTSWSKLRSTITPNAATSPIGDLTASELDIGANGYLYKLGVSVVPNTEYTLSFYIQDINSANNTLAIYDESNASFISIDIPYSVTNQWTRVTHTFTTPTGCTSARPYIQRGVGGSGSVYIWGAQLNAGSTAKTYFPTTDRLNYPRIDYTNGCGKLLIEPQSTNLVPYSEAFNSSSWFISRATVNVNAAISPDGGNTADLLRPNSGVSGWSGLSFPNASVSAGVDYSGSVYVKSGGYNWLQIGGSSPRFNATFANVNLVDGSLGNNNIDVDVVDVGNGWYRISITDSAASTTTGAPFFVAVYDSDVSTRLPDSPGDGTSGVYLYGAQVEQGDYVSSYIPTSGTTVTRTQDTSLTTSSNIAAAINGEEGVQFIDFDRLDIDGQVNAFTLARSIQPSNNYITIAYRSDRILGYLRSNGAYQTTMVSYGTWTMPRIKVAFKWKVNDFALWINGVEVRTDTSGTTFAANTLNRIIFSGATNQVDQQFWARINAIAVYDTALSDADLEELTTL